MRVVIVDPSNFTPPYDQELVRALHELGVTVTWPGRRRRPDDPFPADEPMPQPHYYRASEALRGRLPSALLLILKSIEHVIDSIRLIGEVRKLGADIVHFQWTPIPLVDRWVLAAIRRSRGVVLTVHDSTVFHGNASSPLQRHGWHALLRVPDRLFVHVESARRDLVEAGIEADRITVMAHPVFPKPDEQRLRQALDDNPPADLGYVADRVNFLLFGRLAEYKGLDPLRPAVASLPESVREKTRVVLAGRAAFDVERYERALEEDGLIDVFVLKLGFLPDEALWAAIAQADVVLFPYTDIDASGALMLALPYCPAIVASDIGVFADLLSDGATALLAPPGDIDALAGAIGRMVTDENLRQRLGGALQDLVAEELGWDTAARRTSAVYRGLVEAAGDRR